MARIQLGAGLVIFFASVGITLWRVGETLLLAICVAALLIVAGFTFGPRLPGIKKLGWRWIRHPLKPRFTFGNSPDLTVRLTAGEPQTVVLRVGVKNENWFERENALVNFLAPTELDLKPHEPAWNPEHRGKMMEPTPEPEGWWSDYWAGRVSFAGGSSTLLPFSLTFSKPGAYPIRLRINTQDVYGEEEWPETITVLEDDVS